MKSPLRSVASFVFGMLKQRQTPLPLFRGLVFGEGEWKVQMVIKYRSWWQVNYGLLAPRNKTRLWLSPAKKKGNWAGTLLLGPQSHWARFKVADQEAILSNVAMVIKESGTLPVNFAGREHVPTGKDSSGRNGRDEVLPDNGRSRGTLSVK